VLLNWGELGVSGLLPTGTVTLLLADVDGSTRLWETKPDEMPPRSRTSTEWCVSHRRPGRSAPHRADASEAMTPHPSSRR